MSVLCPPCAVWQALLIVLVVVLVTRTEHLMDYFGTNLLVGFSLAHASSMDCAAARPR